MTVWLSDLKMGYCTTGWWLSQKFCCLEVSDEGEGCAEWRNWGGVEPFQYIFYVLFAVSLAPTEQALSTILARINKPRLKLTKIGPVLVLGCFPGQGIRALCSRIWDIGDQMHLGRIYHQGFFGCRDVLSQRSHPGESSPSRSIHLYRVGADE